MLATERARRRRAARRSTSARYPTHGFASQTVGYSTQGRSRAGIERQENAYLTASNANLGTIWDKLGDKLKGTTITRQQPRAQPARERAEDRRDRRCAGSVEPRVMNPKTGEVYVMASSPTLRPEQDRVAERLREDPPLAERLPRLVIGAAQPRDPGSLPAGLDVQDGDRGRGARRRRLHAGLALRRPRLLHRVRQAGLERAQPDQTAETYGNVELPRRRTSTRSTPSSATSARRSARSASSTRRRTSASTRRRRSSCPRARSRRAGSTTSRRAPLYDNPKLVDPGRLAFGQEHLLATPLQMALVAAAVANNGRS